MMPRKRAEKLLQPSGIDFPLSRELKHDGAEFLPQPVHAFEKTGDPRLGILELLHVGEKSAAFGGEAESPLSGFAPIPDAGFRRQTVERIIQLHRIEMARVEFEHFRRGQLLGIEWPVPVFVVPTGSADVHRARRHAHSL